MKNEGVRKAAQHLADAKKAAAALTNASALDAAEDRWSEFVECFVRFFNKLSAGAKDNPSSDQWVKRIRAGISDDPVLNYIAQSRHANEHTLQDLSVLEPSSLSIGGPGEALHIEHLEIVGGQITGRIAGSPTVTITERKPHLRLLDVTNRGKTYLVPVKAGDALEAAPAAFCEVAIAFCEKTLQEAKGRVR